MYLRSFLFYIVLAFFLVLVATPFSMAETNSDTPLSVPDSPFISVNGPLFEVASSASGTQTSLPEQKAILETISAQKRKDSHSSSTSNGTTVSSKGVSVKADDGTEVELDLFTKKDNPVKWTPEERKFYQDPSKEDLDMPLTLRLKKEIETEDGLFIPQVRGRRTSTFDKENMKSVDSVTDALKDGKNELGVGVEWKGKDRIGFQFDYDQEVNPSNGDSPSQSVGGKIKVEF